MFRSPVVVMVRLSSFIKEDITKATLVKAAQHERKIFIVV